MAIDLATVRAAILDTGGVVTGTARDARRRAEAVPVSRR